MQYSVVNYSQTRQYHDFRIDGEFFAKEFLDVIKKIENNDFFFNNEISIIRSGTTPKDRDENLKKGTVLLKTNNIRNNILIKEDTIDYFYIDEKTDKKMSKTKLKPKDILVNIVGATTDVIGRTSIIFNDFPSSNITQAMALCRLKNAEILPEYLFIFFQTYYGKTQVKHIARPTGQYNLNLQEVGHIRVPKKSNKFQSKIAEIVQRSYKKNRLSKSLYTEAENLLLFELGLKDWKSEHKLTFIKKFSDTNKAKRIDAEHFQPKYDEIEKAIIDYKNGYGLMKNLFIRNKKTFQKEPKRQYKYIEIGCVNIIDGTMEAINLDNEELPANAKLKLKKGDVVISKVRPYRGAIGIVDSDNYVGSGAFTVLQEKKELNKETLMILLRSKPFLDFALKFNTGAMYPTITDEDILNFPMPKIKPEIQNKIKKKIIEMYKSKQEAKDFLEKAKRAVEIAIEKDEKSAIELLNEANI